MLASARLGAGSNLLVSRSGGPAFGVVDTEDYKSLNPHRQIPTLVDPNTGAVVWESHRQVEDEDQVEDQVEDEVEVEVETGN